MEHFADMPQSLMSTRNRCSASPKLPSSFVNCYQPTSAGQSVNSLGTAVTGRALNRYNAWATIRKRAKAAGLLTPVGCHTWRATGITRRVD